MTDNPQRSKGLKRRLIDDEEGSSKRTRTKPTLDNNTNSPNQTKGKSLIAKRLNPLRKDIKKPPETAQQGRGALNLKRAPVQVQTLTRVNAYVNINKGKDELKDCKVSSSTPKKSSINDRFKRARQKSLRKSEDDIIIEIDDSPAPLLHPCVSHALPKNKKSNELLENKVEKVISPKQLRSEPVRDDGCSKQSAINQRLTKIKRNVNNTLCNTLKPSPSTPQGERKSNSLCSSSFIIVSEASGGEGSSAKQTPINRRLINVNRSSSSVKTLTPRETLRSIDSGHTVVRNESPSKGLRTPLRRHLFKSPDKTPTNEAVNCDTKVSSNIFRIESQRMFEQNKQSTISINNNVLSTFGVKMIRKTSSPKEGSSTKNNIFRRGSVDDRLNKSTDSALSSRLTRIRNEKSVSNRNVKPSFSAQNVISANNVCTQAMLRDNSELQVVVGTDNAECPEIFNLVEAPVVPKPVLVQNWMDSTHARPNACDETMSDSLMVNVDDTLLNKTELLTDPQEDLSMEWDSLPEPEPPTSSKTALECRAAADIPLKLKVICVVTDTNVFMHDLGTITDLLNFRVPGNQKLKIYVPWMVLQELDFHKDSRRQPAKSMAMEAQKLIKKHLGEPDLKIIGQSVQDVCQQMDVGKSPDDKILACCLQVKDKYESIILLSNDVNMCNKALTNDIKAYTAKEILNKLKSSRFVKIKVRLQPLLSQIIFQACREAYGEACTKMEMLQDCPWPFEGCLKRFKRYWNTVFGPLLLKQCLKTIDDLIALTSRGDITDADQLNAFINKLKEFLFYLQDFDQFNSSVKKVRDEIDKIV